MEFFKLPLEVKKHHLKPLVVAREDSGEVDTANSGYTAVEQERYSGVDQCMQLCLSNDVLSV
jgi:hypothetical protein